MLFEQCLQNLNIGNNEQKIHSALELQDLIQKGYPLNLKLVEVLQQNSKTKGTANCLELVIDKEPKFIESLDLELLLQELYP